MQSVHGLLFGLDPRAAAGLRLGGVAEWSKAAVLKTARAQALGSSNLPPSACLVAYLRRRYDLVRVLVRVLGCSGPPSVPGP